MIMNQTRAQPLDWWKIAGSVVVLSCSAATIYGFYWMFFVWL